MSNKKHDVFASSGSSSNPVQLFSAIFMQIAFAGMMVGSELATGHPHALAHEALHKKKCPSRGRKRMRKKAEPSS